MPLFGRSTHHNDPVVDTQPVNEAPARKGSIFSRRTHNTPPPATNATTTHTNHSTSPTRTGGFFSRRRQSSDSSSSDNSNRRARKNGAVGTGATTTATTGFFGGSKIKDPTLDAARGKVHAAELAEKEADKALVAARAAVVEARRHVEILEKEANEQARLAQQKILAARGMKEDVGHLGRHG
ncbi:hypothetical protein CPB86DRAFT_780505 [Serendipita vermifera]|nr:hypothetical protein CPB86DRAFT_780505 [Serendipita vermifera]